MSKHLKAHRIYRFHYSGKNPLGIEKLGTCIAFVRTEVEQGRATFHCHYLVRIGHFDIPTYYLICSDPDPKDKGMPKTTTRKTVDCVLFLPVSDVFPPEPVDNTTNRIHPPTITTPPSPLPQKSGLKVNSSETLYHVVNWLSRFDLIRMDAQICARHLGDRLSSLQWLEWMLRRRWIRKNREMRKL